MPSGGQRGRSGTTTEKIADFLARKVGCHNFPPTAGGPKQRCGRHSHSTKRFGGGSTNRRRRHTPPPTSLCRSSTLNETRQRAPPFRVSVYPPEPNQAFNGAPTTLAAPSIGNRAKASTATRQPKSNNKKKMGSDSAANPSPAPAPALSRFHRRLPKACLSPLRSRKKEMKRGVETGLQTMDAVWARKITFLDFFCALYRFTVPDPRQFFARSQAACTRSTSASQSWQCGGSRGNNCNFHKCEAQEMHRTWKLRSQKGNTVV